MANTGFKGVDVVQTGNQLVFRALLQDSTGALITSGTTTVKLYELQSDGTIKSYDFNDNTFKTTALTTATLALTHRTGNNSTTNTGIWTAALSTLTGFTVAGIYFALVNNTGASPTDQVREFQYGSAEGDLIVTAGATGIAYLQDDLTLWKTSTPDALSSGKVPADLKLWLASAPDALSSGKVPADLKLWLTVAPLALSSQQVQAIVSAYASGQAPLQPTVAGRTLDVATTGEAGLDFDNIKDASGAHTLTNIRVPAVTLTDTVTTYTGNTPQTGDNYARLGAPAGASISADIAEIEAETDGIGSDTSGVTTLLARIPGTVQPQTGDSYARLGAPVGASISADIAEVEAETDDIAAVKAKTDSLTFTVANQVDSNVVDWKGAAAPAMSGDAFARLGAPAGASIAADLAEIEVETDDIAAVKAKTDNLPASPAAVGSAMTLTAAYDASKTASQAGDAMALTSGERTAFIAALDAAILEGSITHAGAWRICLAADAAKTNGMNTSTGHIRDIGDTKDRVVATLDGSGNRTAITTLDGS